MGLGYYYNSPILPYERYNIQPRHLSTFSMLNLTLVTKTQNFFYVSIYVDVTEHSSDTDNVLKSLKPGSIITRS